MSDAPAIVAAGLTRTYDRGAVRALDGVDLTVARGEAVAVMGPSGSGKSTLLALLGALDTPTAGTVQLLGESIGAAADRAAVRARLCGFVFQSHHMIPALTLAENVELPLVGRGVPRRERRARALEALAQVGLTERAGHLATRVSGGERQRAAVARALSTAPPILLADEPTGAVDRALGHTVIDLLTAPVRAGQATLVVVTHDPEVAARADRTVHLLDGRVVTAAS